MKCYKVTDSENKSLIISSNTFTNTSTSDFESNSDYVESKNKYSLSYKLNKITQSSDNTLGVFCFKTLDDAKEYIDKFEEAGWQFDYKIYECDGYNEKELPNCILGGIIAEGYLDQYYNTNIPESERNLYFNSQPPEESFICFESIKLLKEVA